MKKELFAVVVAMGLFLNASAQKVSGLKVLNVYPIHGDGGWDYLSIDQKNNNIFVSHGNQVEILSKNGDSLGIIKNTQGVHGIIIAGVFGKGYTTNGRTGNCTVFDLVNFSVLKEISVGQNPDAGLYDDYSKKVIVFNGKSNDASVIDPENDKVIGTIKLGGKPEAGVSDGKGKIYVNIEDSGEIVCFDIKSFQVLKRFKLNGGEEPSGLAIDRLNGRLFTVCANKVMLVLDAKTGKQISSLPIGDGCDGVVFDPQTKIAYSSNGEGTVTAVKELSANKFVVLETVKSAVGARTIAIDLTTHHIFLPTVNFEKVTDAGQRPKRIPGTFKIIEMGTK